MAGLDSGEEEENEKRKNEERKGKKRSLEEGGNGGSMEFHNAITVSS